MTLPRMVILDPLPPLFHPTSNSAATTVASPDTPSARSAHIRSSALDQVFTPLDRFVRKKRPQFTARHAVVKFICLSHNFLQLAGWYQLLHFLDFSRAFKSYTDDLRNQSARMNCYVKIKRPKKSDGAGRNEQTDP
jgi:hypothetical protein